jgi:hypothetical protein
MSCNGPSYWSGGNQKMYGVDEMRFQRFGDDRKLTTPLFENVLVRIERLPIHLDHVVQVRTGGKA